METIPHYVRLAPGDAFPDITQLAPFKAVVVLESDYSRDWQNGVSRWLVESGCRYMLAWGPNCSSWNDSVDWADMEARNYEDDDSKFVMTTWHENQTLEDVFWQAQFTANFSYDDVELRNAVIVDISNEDRRFEFLALFDQSKTLAERENPDA
ncbi:MAG: hypothetical protein ACM3ZV_13140 [Bacillota bacterium]